MVITVNITKNVYGGDGLGRLGDGRVIFVPGAWVGEQVKAEIVEEKKHFVKGRLVEVVDASPDRLRSEVDKDEPNPIPGMVYAGLKYEGELKAKEGQLRDFFERARIACPSIATPVTSDSSPLNYRNKVVYHFAKQGGKWVIGYRKEPSHELVDVESDPLARPEINVVIPEVRKALLALLMNGPQAVRRATAEKENVTIRWSKRTGVKWWIGKAPDDVIIKEDTCGRVFEVPAGGFYQMNPAVGEALVKTVVGEIVAFAKTRGEGTERLNILDLYCGVGVFGLCAVSELVRTSGFSTSQHSRFSLIGIESGHQAIDFAKRNAANLKIADARFFAEEVGRNRRRIPIGANTAVIVDPPRDGLESGVAEWLSASKAPFIAYVSCDPATLIRDLRVITRNYDVVKVAWFNMFPRTARFETLVILRASV